MKGQKRGKCTRRKNGVGTGDSRKKQRIFWNRKRDLSLSCLWRRLTYTRISSCFHKTTPNSVNGVPDGVDQRLFALPTFTFFKGVIYSTCLWGQYVKLRPNYHVTNNCMCHEIQQLEIQLVRCRVPCRFLNTYRRFGGAYFFHLQGSLTNLFISKLEEGRTF